MWKVSGRHIVAAGSLRLKGPVTASDDLGEEILSQVPKELRRDFLSAAGQSAVSYLIFFLYCPGKLNEPQIVFCMGSICSSKLSVVQTHASLIFSGSFKLEWFVSDYDRTKQPVLVELSGMQVVDGCITYLPFPPILFPDGNTENEEDIFMNPVLVRVGYFFLPHVCNLHIENF